MWLPVPYLLYLRRSSQLTEVLRLMKTILKNGNLRQKNLLSWYQYLFKFGFIEVAQEFLDSLQAGASHDPVGSEGKIMEAELMRHSQRAAPGQERIAKD